MSSFHVTSCRVMSAAAKTRCVERKHQAEWRKPPRQISERCRDDGEAEAGRAGRYAAQASGPKELDGEDSIRHYGGGSIGQSVITLLFRAFRRTKTNAL